MINGAAEVFCITAAITEKEKTENIIEKEDLSPDW